MPVNGYYSTKEAAEILGLSHGAVKHAVWRGALQADQVARRHLIPKAEIDRYAREVQGTRGWDKRKQPDYTPNEKQRQYQQAYYQRRKLRRQQREAAQPAESD